ncbi:MAG: HutD family protein [Bdellovibrio sp.]|nr:HutD family protein [Bdellovibrio sp.]
MLTLIPQSQYKIMPWKNGLGQTAQIQIFPEKAQFPDNFTWRLSSALVKADDPFSNFEGCQRVLTVVDGAGLILNDAKLLPGKVIYFSGEDSIYCKLIDGEVLDLGVIWKPDLVSVTLSHRFVEQREVIDLSLKGVHFACVTSGVVRVGEVKVQARDTIKIEQVEQIIIEPDGLQSSVALISIVPVL